MTIPLLHPVIFAKPSLTFKSALSRLGLPHKLCIDAGDFSSLASSAPDKALDTSGNGYDFFFGTGTGADAADPTVNGAVGSLKPSASLSVDGADFLTYDTTNEAWMDNIPKDNALASAAFWVNIASLGTQNAFAGTNGNSLAQIGFDFRLTTGGLIRFRASNGTGVTALTLTSTMVAPLLTNIMVGFSINEALGADGAQLYLNTRYESFTSTYTLPTALASAFAMNLLAQGNGATPMQSGGLFYGCVFSEGYAWTPADFNAFYETTKGRFA